MTKKQREQTLLMRFSCGWVAAKVKLRNMFSRAVLLFVALVSLVLSSDLVFASTLDTEKSRFESDWELTLRTKTLSDLSRYCPDGCTLLGIEVESNEVFDTNSANLGFETAVATARRFAIRRAQIEVLVDNRMGTSNIERLQDVLNRAVKKYGAPVEIELTRTTFPDPPQLVRAEAQAKQNALELVRTSYEKVVSDFCPDECRLHSVEIKTTRIAVDEISAHPARQIVVIPESKWALLINGSTVQLNLDEQIDDIRRGQIVDLIRDSMEAYGAPLLNVKRTEFPRTARQIQKDAEELKADPWGLERLGRALRIFKEFANTKEIIKERDTLSKESEKSSEKSEKRSDVRETKDKEREREKERESSQTEKERERENTNLQNADGGAEKFWTQERILLVSGVVALLLLVGAFGLRYVLTGKQVQHLISEGRGGHPETMLENQTDAVFDPALAGVPLPQGSAPRAHVPVYAVAQNTSLRSLPQSPVALSDDVALRLNLQTLRDELMQAFIAQPKMSREVFARILREDGIEFSAKCVSVLGEVVVFDLVGDDDLKKEVTLLAEYIHVSTPFVSDSEQLSILRNLKMKMTAAKMRMITQRSQDAFEFLRSQSARQIYNLVADESARTQAVVLTQLATEKRRMVFELFTGARKSGLLRELCIKESLPREYLQNVAEALRRKMQKAAGSDGEILGGADVILDLMERSDRDGQVTLMSELDKNNTELARQVRSRLVSVESLAYLSDGLLLEIFLSMEPQSMVVFLAGVREHIRNLILNKAPDEVAADWTESASSVKGIDPEIFRLAEMQVLGKIRAFASNGLIDIIEINEIMYPRQDSDSPADARAEESHRIPLSSLVVA